MPRRLARLEQLAALSAFYQPLSVYSTGCALPHGRSQGEGMGKTSSCSPEPFPPARSSPIIRSRLPCRMLFAPLGVDHGPICGGLVPAGRSLLLQRFPYLNRKQIALDENYAGIFFIRAGLKLWKIYCNSSEPWGNSLYFLSPVSLA